MPAVDFASLPVRPEDVLQARDTIQGVVRRTPLVPSPELPGIPEGRVFLKLENLQRTGAFKIRGAVNRLAHLSPDETKHGVVTASAGNHAQGVAFAARARGVPATIVMARNASPLKVSATAALGARIVLHGADYEEASEEAHRLSREERLTYVPPFDDPLVIAGQGTIGLEILEDLPETRTIVAGVGGGGLLAGIGVAARSKDPSVRLVGVQPTGADTLRPSLAQGRVVVGSRPATFADGLATRHVGDITFRILRALQVEAYAVDDRATARAAFLLLERGKQLVEGAGAAPLAALLEHPDLAEAGPVVLVLSGGNLDPFLLDRILFIGLSAEGRLLRIRVALADVPGQLADLLTVAAHARANVRHIVHNRETPGPSPTEVSVDIELEVRDSAHAAEVLKEYRSRGWAAERTDGVEPSWGKRVTTSPQPRI